MTSLVFPALSAALLLFTSAAPGPVLRSGPQAGSQVLPFTSTMVTGANRGRQHCYVCELSDEPAVLVFARGTTDATRELMARLTAAVAREKEKRLFGWFVFLTEKDAGKELQREREIFEFVKRSGCASLPVSVLGDPAGPPGFKIDPEAEVTILQFRRRRVLSNQAYRASEWNLRKAEEALAGLPALLESRP